MPSIDTEKQQLALKAGRAFSPTAPVRERDVFAGRTDQIRFVIDAINQPGQHALIYGERGVGKTSLANVLADFLDSTGQTHIVVPHITCDGTDDFSSLWRKVFRQIPIIERRQGFGFDTEIREEVSRLSNNVGDDLKPGDILSIALSLSSSHLFIPIIDEFDRLQESSAARLLTDTIKSLSDNCPLTTIVLVGVADTVEQLIAEHQSVERALAQVRMPRMSRIELDEIITNGCSSLGMSCEKDACGYITALSQGLPHYTHLLGLHAVRRAIDDGQLEVRLEHVDSAIRAAISGTQQTLLRAYHRATMSQRSDALYQHVLLAAALSRTDELGYFAAADIRQPMSRIMGRAYEIPAFSRHLFDFCEDSRGPVLERTGVPRRYRFRFTNPLVQPYVIMQGLSADLIDRSDVSRFRSR